MCGIVGQYNFGGPADGDLAARDRASIVRMREIIAHRGPDDSGLWQSDGWARGPGAPSAQHRGRQRRRSPADVQRGRGGVDHLQRRDLQPRRRSAATSAWTIATSSALAPTPRCWCTSTRSASSDSCRRSTGCSRSACGTRRESGCCSCATAWARSRSTTPSSAAGFCSHPRSRRCSSIRRSRGGSISSRSNQYLTFSNVPEPRTLFDGIRKLPAGHLLTCDRGRLPHDRALLVPSRRPCLGRAGHSRRGGRTRPRSRDRKPCGSA